MWARFEGPSSHINDQAGPVRSVHLFREVDGIHHEFVLVRFEGAKFGPSWLRIERAARFKQRRHKLQLDSFGPLFAGVTLRESVSFGCSKTDLMFHEAEELGSVSIVSELDDDSHSLYLQELTDQVFLISNTCPKYRLLSHNCRWLARRILLTFAQRQNRLAPNSFCVTWNDLPSSYAALDNLLSKDPFGGRPADGKHGAWINALGLMHSADIYRMSGRDTEALQLCEENIPLVRKMIEERPSESRKVLLSHCLLTHYIVLQHLNRYEEAIQVASESLKIIFVDIGQSSSARIGENRTGLFIHSLFNLQNMCGLLSSRHQFEAAEEGQSIVVAHWRSLYEATDGTGPVALYYMQCRGNMALRFSASEKHGEACAEGEAAVRGIAALHRTRHDLYTFDLAWLLCIFSQVLHKAGRTGEAYLVSELSVFFYRQEYALNPDPCRSSYAVALYEHAILASEVGADCYASVGEECLRDAIEATRELYRRHPSSYRANLSVMLSARRVNELKALVHPPAKIPASSSQCIGTEKIWLSQPQNLHTWVTQGHRMLDTMYELIDLYRELARSDPVFNTYFLVKELTHASEMSRQFGRTEQSVKLEEELATVVYSANEAGIDVVSSRPMKVSHFR